MTYLVNNPGIVAVLLGQHLQLTLETLFFSLLIALPVGVLLSRIRWLQGPVLGILGVIYTIPSLALFVILIPLFGLGTTPAIIALVAYSQLVLVRNWLVGLTSLDPAMIEAARGIGMNNWQRFWTVEFPLASPYLLAGIRLAILSSIGIGMIAAYISAGGLGTLLFEGVTTANYQKITAGALASSVLAIGANFILRYIEHRVELRTRGEVKG